MNKTVFVFCMCVMVAGLGMAAEKDGAAQITAAVPGTGSHVDSPDATLFVVYDDGSFESNSAVDLTGNKFASGGAAWGTFYVDQMSFYVDSLGGTAVWLTSYTSLNTAGTDLGGADYLNLGGLTHTGWWYVDGSTTPVDWIGNTTVVFTDTAWIAADNTSDYIGVDTSTTGGHGFTIASYSGDSYSEDSGVNAALRARVNGDNVPVELQAFSIE